MASFNKVIIMGNITRDIELRYTPSGTAVIEIGVATNRRTKQGEEWVDEVTFTDVTIWGKSAENVSQYLGKGSGIHIDGRLAQDSWTDKDTGKQRTKLKVVAESVQFLSGGGKSEQPKPQQGAAQSGSHPMSDDDIPF